MSPSFSSDEEDQFHPGAPVSPITTPTHARNESNQCPVPPVPGVEQGARYKSLLSYANSRSTLEVTTLEPCHLDMTSCIHVSCAVSFSCNTAKGYIKTHACPLILTLQKTVEQSTTLPTSNSNPVITQCNGLKQSGPSSRITLTSIVSSILLPSPSLNILRVAAEAAGLEGDDVSIFSIDSPEDLNTDYDPDAPYDPESPPFDISKPNQKLLEILDMPKSKSKGKGEESPPKASRNQGKRVTRIELYINRYEVTTCTIKQEHSFSLNTVESPTDDFLNMSGVQEPDDTLHSSELDSTLQGRTIPSNIHPNNYAVTPASNHKGGMHILLGDASMNSEKSEQADQAGGGDTPSQGHFGNRQSTPNPETPQSNAHGKESEDESDSGEDEDDNSEAEDDVDAKSKAERDLQSDLGKVREAVSMAGGLNSRKPDFEKQKEREGQHVEIVEQWMDFTEESFKDLPERPEESPLRRISLQELLPPATSAPVPLDLELDGEELSFVANQRIEFLVLMRKEGDSKSSWGFPFEAQLLKMYNHVRNAADHDLIMDECLWCRVDQATGIASIMLSTIHLPLF